MKINIAHNFPAVMAQIDREGKGMRSAAREALNRTADHAKREVIQALPRYLDRPTDYVRRSLSLKYASTSLLQGELWFKRRNADRDDIWARHEIEGGGREMKPMEIRLQRAGILPAGWLVVPGAAAPMNANGNMSKAEVNRIMLMLGNITQDAKAQKKRNRLAKGSKKAYGMAYWVNPVSGPNRAAHLLPGVYRRVFTGFGSTLDPMLIFIRSARYSARLPFLRIVQDEFHKRFPGEFDKAIDSLLRTGSASGARRIGR